MHWMILPLKRYADFQGRSRRMEYWMFALMNLIIISVLAGPALSSILAASVMGSDDAAAEAILTGMGTLSWIGLSVYGLYALAILIPGIAVVVRRLHDRDMSGWWYLGFIVASFIPLIGLVASIAFIVVMLLPGTPGPNRFGPDPKDPSNAGVFE
ncbi:DUF805 domain-containing protein [Erythrobacter insulae]|uniref:DUF805 domain-containing protein n=1 Tax=Erythrobacter insulae TaxID=2584124 RepID=A0A547PDE6_9SPHN|nr:DUF805 domain-containing protein [Erythrobacter insulae]TRD12171.1 DUF805 domain-containing protein [Erythrobacter insulae]